MELRAQIARCETQLYGGQSEPRLEARSPCMSRCSAGPPLEEELSWIVKQMEAHRKQIQAHQQQLSALEKRHAELVAALSVQSLGRSPASSVAESRADTTLFRLPEGLTLGDPSEGPDFSAVSAAELRLGLRPSARPTSAGSAPSGSLGLRSALGRHRPFSAGSRVAGLAATAMPDRASWGTPSPRVGDGAERAERPERAEWAGPGPPSPAPEARAPRPQESERIARLLEELGRRRPLRVPFVPLPSPLEGEGRPYLHGSLEVRLLLSDDGNRLLVRVGVDPAGGGGRLFDIDEFIARAEAIESRRVHRPIPIAEEEPVTAELTDGKNGKPYLRTMLGGGKDPSVSSGSLLPWKDLFKAHWGSR